MQDNKHTEENRSLVFDRLPSKENANGTTKNDFQFPKLQDSRFISWWVGEPFHIQGKNARVSTKSQDRNATHTGHNWNDQQAARLAPKFLLQILLRFSLQQENKLVFNFVMSFDTCSPANGVDSN